MKTKPAPGWPEQFRKARGARTQQETADLLCGCPIATVRDWEQARRIPPVWVRALILERLKARPIREDPAR